VSKIRSSLAYSTLDSYVGLVLQIASTVVLSRLLTPQQAGTFAVAMVFASLASTFRDFGVAEYLIQEKELDDDKLRAALSVNLGVSWFMAACMFGFAPAIAAFYRTPEITDVMRVQALNFVLIPFGAVTMAWFRREMDFRPIFIANAVASVVQFGVAIVLALRGHGVMALAFSSLAGVATTVGCSVLLRPRGFPRWPGRRGIAAVLHFGKFASGIYIFGQLGKGAPEMIIGRAQDMAAVGMFSRGGGLVEIFHRLVLRAVMPVCLPYYARSVREGGTPVPALLRTMAFLTAVGWPFLLFMAIGAYAVIRLMYGAQWLAAVPLAQVLCAAAAIELVYYPAKEALLSVGKVRESNQLQIGVQLLRVLGLLACVPFGLPGAAWGLLVAAALGGALSHHFLARHVGLRLGAVLGALRASVPVTLLSIVPFAAWAVLAPIGESNFVLLGIGGGLLCAACWLPALRLAAHPLWPEVARMLSALRARLPGGRTNA
jgi:O-antigen/teichoic acid export membrane protein